jgi:hypothetical protein
VRDGLKSQIKSRMLAELAKDPAAKNNPFAALGALVIPAMVDGAVEIMVTPNNLATLIREGKAAGLPVEPETAPGDPTAEQGQAEKEAGKRSNAVSAAYAGLDQFVVAIDDADNPGAPVELTLERRNVFGWRLVDVALPETGRPT